MKKIPHLLTGPVAQKETFFGAMSFSSYLVHEILWLKYFGRIFFHPVYLPTYQMNGVKVYLLKAKCIILIFYSFQVHVQ